MTKKKERASRIRKQLEEIPKALKKDMDVILGERGLLRGYVYRSRRRCGKPSCKCARGELHEVWVLETNIGGKRTTRSISGEKGKRIANLTGNYRRFREAQRSFRRRYEEALGLIRELEELVCVEVPQGKQKRRKK